MQVAVGRHTAARLDDAALLGGDLRDGVSQNLGVLQRDGADNGQHRRIDDVGAVQQAADAHLDHGRIHPGLGKDHKRQGGEGLKLGAFLIQRLHFVKDGEHALQRVGHQLFVHQLAAELDALAEIKDEG